MLAACAARQQQDRHVDAGDHKKQKDTAEKKIECPSHRPLEKFMDALYREFVSFDPEAGMGADHLLEDRPRFFCRFGMADAGPEPHDCGMDGGGIRGIKRYIYLGIPPVESWRHDAKDGVVAIVETQLLADDRAISIEPVLPVLVGQYGNGLRRLSFRRIGGQEGSAQIGGNTEKWECIAGEIDDVDVPAGYRK